MYTFTNICMYINIIYIHLCVCVHACVPCNVM